MNHLLEKESQEYSLEVKLLWKMLPFSHNIKVGHRINFMFYKVIVKKSPPILRHINSMFFIPPKFGASNSKYEFQISKFYCGWQMKNSNVLLGVNSLALPCLLCMCTLTSYFLHKIPRTNIYTFVLYRKILCHPLNT